MTAVNVAMDGNTRSASIHWIRCLEQALNAAVPNSYSLVCERALVGLLVCVFVRRDLLGHLTDIRATHLGVGVMGMLGNKGGVSVRFNFRNTSFCFVCAHLAAHRENLVGRHNDAKNILEKSVFSMEDATENMSLLMRPAYGKNLVAQQDVRPLEHDYVFFLGDLNYRLDEDLGLETERIFEVLAKDGGLAALRDYDQLLMDRKVLYSPPAWCHPAGAHDSSPSTHFPAFPSNPFPSLDATHWGPSAAATCCLVHSTSALPY